MICQLKKIRTDDPYAEELIFITCDDAYRKEGEELFFIICESAYDGDVYVFDDLKNAVQSIVEAIHRYPINYGNYDHIYVTNGFLSSDGDLDRDREWEINTKIEISLLENGKLTDAYKVALLL